MTTVLLTIAEKSGAARYVYNLHKSLNKEMNEFILVCPTNYEYATFIPSQKIITYASASSYNRYFRLISNIAQLMDTVKVIKKINNQSTTPIKIIHFNFFLILPLAIIQANILKKYSHSTVLTIHDVLPHKRPTNKLSRWLQEKFYQHYYKMFDGLIVHDASQHKSLENLIGKRNNVKIIPHGLFNLTEKPLAYPGRREINLLCMGSIRENKGIDLAIIAFQRLRKYNNNITLTITGASSKGEFNYWKKCKQLIKENPQGIIIDEGYKSDAELLSHLTNCNAVLMPYRDFHSQSGVAVMALSHGRPIIVTGSGGLQSFLDSEQKIAVRIPEPTISGVESAIEEFINMPESKANDMAQSAYFYTREHLSWDSISKKHLTFFRSIR